MLTFNRPVCITHIVNRIINPMCPTYLVGLLDLLRRWQSQMFLLCCPWCFGYQPADVIACHMIQPPPECCQECFRFHQIVAPIDIMHLCYVVIFVFLPERTDSR